MDPKLWWYLARVGGLMSWWLLSATVVWGLLVRTRVLGHRAPHARLLDLHRFLAGFSLSFLVLHLLGLVADSWVDIGLLQIVIPFTSAYRPVAVAWGVAALYLVAAVQTTSLLKSRIPQRWWRYVHYSTFPLFLLTTVHALTAGTDEDAARWTALLVGAAVTFLAVYRLVVGRRTDDGPSAERPTRTADAQGSRPVVVTEVQRAADGVVTVEFAAADGAVLPSWEPGAHIDLVLPSGLIRSYSLCGDPDDPATYRVAVLRFDDGRGGSAEVHRLREGQRIAVRGPRNRFPLVLAERYVFLAGGITALLPMIRAVEAADRDWSLVYGARSRTAMAFTEELQALGGDRVRLVPQDTDGLPDLAGALKDASTRTAVYACGPEPLLRAVESAVAARGPDRRPHLHVERFHGSGAAGTVTGARAFEVELRRSGRVLPVPVDRSLLDVLRTAVPTIEYSCGEGVCGSCELRVLDGIPDHRDNVLPRGDRARRDVIYPCVSRARSPMLTLDL
ncbi:2Fe-2S iron-sulfur cluster-binding protein [Streptomyces sp. P9(2023)]|uniref:2Fe-2S iron-sulfur cluster-binding protein n=1 Tax=Streptomyces sp. P9(2023) TaxID=3064394 RepID=UPI0028F44F1A|nr:2Fe-2S iron-sulfur cluster-binding protein [Streptomyces sp. P9(2023)]MDT9691897.1 2Fe-2S iron-sulfur cluster-binding protein [Streptomyces sp. P9(2023)]